MLRAANETATTLKWGMNFNNAGVGDEFPSPKEEQSEQLPPLFSLSLSGWVRMSLAGTDVAGAGEQCPQAVSSWALVSSGPRALPTLGLPWDLQGCTDPDVMAWWSDVA